jgi:hypothetical protein
MLYLTSIKEEINRVWAISGMTLTEKAAILVENPVPVSLCPPKIPHKLILCQT